MKSDSRPQHTKVLSASLCLTLALVLTLTLAAPALAANSGGVEWPDPFNGNPAYMGTQDNAKPTATGGSLHMDSDYAGNVYGGFSTFGDATGNSVFITGGRMGGDVTNSGSGNVGSGEVFGGYSIRGDATGNSVVITGGRIGGNVIENNGDVTSGNVYGGHSDNGNTTGNSVVISDGIFGGTVINSGSTVSSGNVFGGDSGGSGTATGNRVVITGGTFGGTVNSTAGDVTSGNVYGGRSNGGDASGNSVFISGGRFGGDVTNTGGLVYSGNVYGGWSTNGNASNNNVVITGGVFGGTVSGGSVYGGWSKNGNATGNTVTLMGSPVFITNTVGNGFLIGGAGLDPGKDYRTNNTLNVFTSGLVVRGISRFQYYNFALQGSDGASLTLTDTYAAVFEAGDVVRVPHALPGSALHAGQRVTLLSATTAMSGLTAPMLPNGQATQGISLIYDYTLTQSADSKSLSALVTNVDVNPQAKALTQGRTAALGFATMGGDLIAGAGMDNARGATAVSGPSGGAGLSGGSDSAYGLIPFFAVQGSSLRYNTGSHVDVNGAALMTGLAKKWQASTMDVLAGVFFEAAFGSYKTNNSFSSGGAKGKGDTRTLGGGILARLDMTDTALKGLYAEASLRAGSLNNDYKNSDLRDATDNSAAYDVSSAYYGAHAGLGYIWNITDKASLDMSAKYFWTHQQGQDVKILGDKFSFKDSDSHRTRLGARFGYAALDTLTPYIGAAWEYEFDGKARATVYGFDLPSPNVKGSTGVGEVGLVWKPEKAQGFAVDLGVQGSRACVKA